MTGARGAESEYKAMNEQAREARRAYKRQWAKQNPEKVKAQQERYWAKRAAADKQQQPPNKEGEQQ